MMRFHLIASFVLVLTLGLATNVGAYGALVNARPNPNRGGDILKRSADDDNVTTAATSIVPTTTSSSDEDITNVTNITHVPTDDDDSDEKKKKKEREPVRGELWGIIMSVAGFLIVSAMTVTLWFMARKKKRIEAKRKEAALFAPSVKK